MYMHHILNIIYKVFKKLIANTYVRFYVHRVNYAIYQGTFKRRKINSFKGLSHSTKCFQSCICFQKYYNK